MWKRKYFIFQIKIKHEENDENQEIKTYYKIQKKTENNEWEVFFLIVVLL